MDTGARDRMFDALDRVGRQRELRSQEPGLTEDVARLKGFQQRRLVGTYPDLLAHARWGPACRFFLDELYGPADFTVRDRELGRVIPSLVRLFPDEVVATVERLLALHAVSEELDTAMARCVSRITLDGAAYRQAWQTVGARELREWQVASVVGLGRSLDALVRHRPLRTSLRLMRGPARLAGLALLQGFLERGFDAFAGMGGAEGFLLTVEQRESLWLDFLFEGRDRRLDDPAWLGQFP